MMDKRRYWFPLICCMMLVTVLISGCGNQQASPKKAQSFSIEDLQKYASQLITLEAVFEKHQVKPQSTYGTDKGVFLEVRRVGEHDKTLSDAEKSKFKQAIFKAVGAEFPLNITVYAIDEQSGTKGKITAIDGKGRFLVVKTDKFINQEKKMPDATWYAMSDDAVIMYEGKKFNVTDMQIGSSVTVWSEGMMLTSYPGQTTGLRLQINTLDDGLGDLSGKVTSVTTSGEGVNLERMLDVDGVKYRMFPFTQVWKDGVLIEAATMKEGDHVKLWFAGYEIGPEKMVTKVVITN
ncbi:DUF3221 domain-containing protein [Paenibacillus qinlingensis]|uniref:DUF3221 domain-containing protein n=1 Tax=Paenibacillus qinlingensis TaxID=1837343 RepID=A0ABU1NR57_9BACL|nr:DUF3221 domain-containing protein [Paenibacillus qinlingensis]MDR6549972.1 hypothetical protein [Paenibacillus qinlingensis]